ncbi:MAG TPA: hypothetical protein VGQ00_02430 [Candidatus Norongarragalinales archaeon]|jgi:hypothetical protein|nr:hypothetical protein [Candidatus Norongarragalinales archaeon]
MNKQLATILLAGIFLVLLSPHVAALCRPASGATFNIGEEIKCNVAFNKALPAGYKAQLYLVQTKPQPVDKTGIISTMLQDVGKATRDKPAANTPDEWKSALGEKFIIDLNAADASSQKNWFSRALVFNAPITFDVYAVVVSPANKIISLTKYQTLVVGAPDGQLTLFVRFGYADESNRASALGKEFPASVLIGPTEIAKLKTKIGADGREIIKADLFTMTDSYSFFTGDKVPAKTSFLKSVGISAGATAAAGAGLGAMIGSIGAGVGALPGAGIGAAIGGFAGAAGGAFYYFSPRNQVPEKAHIAYVKYIDGVVLKIGDNEYVSRSPQVLQFTSPCSPGFRGTINPDNDGCAFTAAPARQDFKGGTTIVGGAHAIFLCPTGETEDVNGGNCYKLWVQPPVIERLQGKPARGDPISLTMELLSPGQNRTV